MRALLQKTVAVALCCFSPATHAIAQQLAIEPAKPSAPILWRPYLSPQVPPVRLTNSDRLNSLIRAGKLYLTAQDAIALVLENNIDVELARYTPITLAWRLERSQAGGALPGVPSSASQVNSVQSGQGVIGSQNAAGVSGGNSNNSNSVQANATISQVGPVTAALDPIVQEATTFSHRSAPQPLLVQTGSANLVQSQHTYTASYQEGLPTGGNATLSYNEHYLNENAASDLLNPSVAPALSLTVRQNLLRGFGLKENARNITVAKTNLQMSDLNFKTQVSNAVNNVLYIYYGLVADYDDMRSKQQALEAAIRFLAENRQRLDLGSLAQLDVTTALNLLAAGQQTVVNAQTQVQQRELQLKNVISRTGIADPALAAVSIVPLDHITIPPSDDLPPLRDMVKQAMLNRSDILAGDVTLSNAVVSAIGTRNGLMPTVQVFATKSNAGLAGVPRTYRGVKSDPYFDGGIGTALGDIARNNFPSQSIGLSGGVNVYNRQAQADFEIEQLQLRQNQLSSLKDNNQLQVDISNAVVALRQARARYDAAVQNRILSQQLFDAEQKKFTLGASTSFNVVQQERDLATAQSSELSASATWQSARLNLDQTTGTTLETSHVSLAEAHSGKVARPSAPPAQ